jgi:polyhydroxyalkanoate synthase
MERPSRTVAAHDAATPRSDRRFRDPAWSDNALFDCLKQSYLFSADAMLSVVCNLKGLKPKDAHKIEFYLRQFLDAIAPSNFLVTNPEVLRMTLETCGNSLVKGLANLLDDMERGGGVLLSPGPLTMPSVLA